METVSQALMGINNPRRSFQDQMIVTLDVLSQLPPEKVTQVLRSLLWVGAHIAIDEVTALHRTVEMMRGAVETTPVEQQVFAADLSKELFPGEV